MRGSRVCCFETKTITRILGWFQAIGSGLGIVGTLGYLLYYGTKLNSDSQKTLIMASYKLRKIGGVIFTSAMLIIFLLILLSLAVLLLVGSYKRKPIMFSFFTSGTIGVLIGVATTFISLIRMEQTNSEIWNWSMLFLCHALWSVLVFSLIVANKHKKDIASNLVSETHPPDTA